MYTITFYSFKGGVGRTMALVNVGTELARMGRRVLLVDFDLEAPGLETFDRLRPPGYRRPKLHQTKIGPLLIATRKEEFPTNQPGIVEYVTEYLRTKRAPDVCNYVYSASPVGKKGGQLWVMPAGRRDSQYQSALANIDWLALYRKHDGFLLFEDTKAQWEQKYKPDYVLIDSRTGHTDVEGICTRQLPDAVVMLFYPNEQNLVGLKEVCRRIRAEELNEIRQYFVMSNVPDLDDEEGILRRCVEEFDTELDIGGRPDAVIHRSESATLFNQAVFVLDRPRSRLAREYRRLVGKLIMHNPADRDGALRFLVAYCNEFKRETALARDLVGNVQLTPQGAWMRSLAREDYGPGFGANPLDQIARNFPADAEIEMHVKRCKEAASERKAALANWQRRQANPKVEPGMVT